MQVARCDVRISNDAANKEDVEPDITRRVADTVIRYMPTDTRDPRGTFLHFYMGDSYDSYR